MMRGDSIFTWDKFNDNEDIRKQAMQSAANGGPNSGFEIPNVDIFKQPELANEFPEMKDDIDLIVSTEAYVNRLCDFYGRMKQAKGMSRGMAYELIELVPDMESFVKPNGFTEDVSGVGYKPSLESISAKMWVVIAAAIAFLVALIYKFINWLFGGESESGGSGDLNKAKEGIKESEKKLENQDHAVEKTIKAVQGAKTQHIEMEVPAVLDHKEIENSRIPQVLKNDLIANTDDLIKGIDPVPSRKHHISVNLAEILTTMEGGEEAYRYMRNPSKYARLIYGLRNKAVDLVMASFDGFAEAASLVTQQLQLLEDMFEHTDDRGNSENTSEAMKFSSSLKVLEEMVLDKNTLKFGGYTFDTIPHWAQQLKDDIAEYGSQEPNYNDLEELLVGYHLGVRRMREVRFVRLITFIELLQKGEPTLKKLESLANHLSKTTKYEGSKDEDKRAQQIMRIHRALSTNFVGLMRVYAEISRVYAEVSKHGYQIVDTLRKNAGEIIHFYNKFGEMIPPSLEELAEELVETTKEMDENIVRPHLLPSQWVSADRVRVSFTTDGEDDEHGSMEISAASAADLRKITGL